MKHEFFDCKDLKIKEIKTGLNICGIKKYHIINGNYTIWTQNDIIVNVKDGLSYEDNVKFDPNFCEHLIGAKLKNLNKT